MIGASVSVTATTGAVKDAADKATAENVGQAAGRIRKDAIASITPSDMPSPPGQPPHTHGGRNRKGKGKLPKSILFAVDKSAGDAVIGPARSKAGTVGQAHEFGGRYKGEQFAERPFMGPALDRQQTKFAASFAGSIG